MCAKYVYHSACEEVRKLRGVSSGLPLHRINIRLPQVRQAMFLAQICPCYTSLSHDVCQLGNFPLVASCQCWKLQLLKHSIFLSCVILTVTLCNIWILWYETESVSYQFFMNYFWVWEVRGSNFCAAGVDCTRALGWWVSDSHWARFYNISIILTIFILISFLLLKIAVKYYTDIYSRLFKSRLGPLLHAITVVFSQNLLLSLSLSLTTTPSFFWLFYYSQVKSWVCL